MVGTAVGGISVSGQAAEIATQVSSQFVSDTANDGLLSLVFSSLNTAEIASSVCYLSTQLINFPVAPQRQKTFFDTAKPSLSFSVFIVDLKYHAPGM